MASTSTRPRPSTPIFLVAIALLALDVVIVHREGPDELAVLIAVAACIVVVVAMRRRQMTNSQP